MKDDAHIVVESTWWSCNMFNLWLRRTVIVLLIFVRTFCRQRDVWTCFWNCQ